MLIKKLSFHNISKPFLTLKHPFLSYFKYGSNINKFDHLTTFFHKISQIDSRNEITKNIKDFLQEYFHQNNNQVLFSF